VVEENIVHHSEGVFVTSTAEPHHPQQIDPDLKKTRETFKSAVTLCDSNGKSITTINNASQENDLDLLDSDSSSSIISSNPKKQISKNKSKQKNGCVSLKDSYDSDGSLSDDFVKKGHSSSKVKSKVFKRKRSPTSNDDSPSSDHETVLVRFFSKVHLSKAIIIIYV